MANNLTTAAANLILDAEPALYVQLHNADPTDAGTAGAILGGRYAVTLGAAAAGARTNTAKVTSIAAPAAVTATHASLWGAATGGVCRWQGPLTASVPVALGQTCELAIGALSISLT